MEVIALPLKEDSGKGHTIVEGNRAAVNAPVLETLSLTRRFGEHTAVDSLTVAGSISYAHYILPRMAARRGPELESAGACRRALRRNLGSGAVFHPVPDHCFGGQDARTLMGIGQVLTMPLFFASNAIYPASIMPFWLQTVAHANPLTYEVEALRALMLMGGASSFGLVADFSILLVAVAIMVMIGGKLYPRVAT